MRTETNNFIKSTDHSKFYTELSGDKICPDLKPDSEEAKQFWESIWSVHNMAVER